MLDRIKATGRGVGEMVSANTVSRELSIIAAVINFAKVEFGLPDSFTNPFNKLPVARAPKGTGTKAADKRDPLPPQGSSRGAPEGPCGGWIIAGLDLASGRRNGMQDRGDYQPEGGGRGYNVRSAQRQD